MKFPHEPEPSSLDSFNDEARNNFILHEMREMGARHFSELFNAQPERYKAALKRSKSMAEAILKDLDITDSLHPALSTVQDTLTRLIFLFTDQENIENTVQNKPINELIATMLAATEATEGEINFQAFANSFDVRLILMYICYTQLGKDGTLDHYTDMNELFIIVRDYTPIYFEDEADEPS